jgi:enterochelin esterase-like enzyme
MRSATVAAVEVHRDLLSSWWTVVALGAAALVLLTVAVHRRRTRRRPGRSRRVWPAAAAAGLAVVLAVLVGANAVEGYVPDLEGLRIRLGLPTDRAAVAQPTAPVTTDPDAPVAAAAPTTGAGAAGPVRIPVEDDLRIPAGGTWVYTPPGFDDSGAVRYPVLYLLHGVPGSAEDWTAVGMPGVLDELIDAGEIRPMIVVSPDTEAVDAVESSCLDSTRGGSQVETYLESVVVPWVDTHYPTADDRRYRGIGGMSSGAYCALDQGLRHADRYGTILALMPYGEPGAGGAHQLGSAEQIAAHSPDLYADTIPLPDDLGVYLAYGSQEADDQVGRTARDLGERLAARGVGTAVVELPGRGHSWTTAMAALPDALRFFEQRMADPP